MFMRHFETTTTMYREPHHGISSSNTIKRGIGWDDDFFNTPMRIFTCLKWPYRAGNGDIPCQGYVSTHKYAKRHTDRYFDEYKVTRHAKRDFKWTLADR